jgi:hypothetical protein
MSNRAMAEVLADALDLTDQPGQTWSWDEMSQGLERFFDYLRTLDDPALALDASALVGVVQALASELEKYRSAEQVVHDVRAITWDWYPYVEPLVAFLEAESAGSGAKLRELVSALSAHQVTLKRPLVLEFFDTVRGDAGPDGVVKVSQFWWRVRHTSNGLIVGASSEGYSSRGARDDNAALLHPDLEPVEVDS